ncbi:FecR domain-containing protein [Mucilaginibacter sp. Bleaf8]|uniref:FecR family protein n=1 Tax=Mucilaginibacter sp. Bleaf8 TaxID=2834430 RepID=UPI001BCA8543|nr:FecR family protein [Mucilaginibacter sp. Bleaf8]MBS7562932.1 FecR domain-containing protein [Mucilaginibacter sp. Bleaf8]
MQPTDELIKRYLNRECSPEEAEQVHEYLSKHPEVLDEHLKEQEWKKFTHYKNLPQERSDAILKNILQRIEHVPAVKVFTLNRVWISGIAACIALAIATIFMYRYLQPSPVTTQPTIVHNPTKVWQHTVNPSRQTLYLRMDDGSRIALAPKSDIRYTLPFKAKTRDIYLNGVAKFYVAKDKTRPFTVYAGPLATTALGTVFKITAWPGSTRTKVRLLSGKVRVAQYNHPDTNPAFLLPGKELVFDQHKHTLEIASFSTKPSESPKPAIEGSMLIRGDTVTFTNQQLPLVIAKLQQVYMVRIKAQTSLKKYYFTGEFNTRTEQVSNILNTITSLNKLRYTLKDSTYIISKN